MMRVYFDTEFTDLWDAYPISFGFAGDDETELYVEVPYPGSAVCPFARREIIPLLTKPEPVETLDRTESYALARQMIYKYLTAKGRIELVTDFIGDYWLLTVVLSHEVLSRYVVPRCTRGFTPKPDDWTSRGLRHHHALDDAKLLRAFKPELQIEEK